MQSISLTARPLAVCKPRRQTLARAGDNHVSPAHAGFVPRPQPPVDWDEVPVMSVDAETHRSMLSLDSDGEEGGYLGWALGTAAAQATQPAAAQGKPEPASFLHVWHASYCDAETTRNSMESTDMYLSE